MQTPDYLEALVTKDIKRICWQNKQANARQLQNTVVEYKRREKLAKVERLLKDKRRRKPMSENLDLSYMLHPFRMKRLVGLFCKVTGETEEEIFSPSKKRQLALKRQFLMWILHQNCNRSTPAIGRLLGGRDHSTILHGIDKIAKCPELLLL